MRKMKKWTAVWSGMTLIESSGQTPSSQNNWAASPECPYGAGNYLNGIVLAESGSEWLRYGCIRFRNNLMNRMR
jgi:hypothetical protein